MKSRKIAFALFIAIVFSLSYSESVEAQIFNVGDKDLNIQIGLGSPYVIINSYSTLLPPISVSFDYGLRDDWGPGIFGIGGYVGMHAYKWESTYYDFFEGRNVDYGTRYFAAVVAARATYHYQFVDNLDTYGGAMAGIRFEAANDFGGYDDYEGSGGASPIGSAFVGAKYYLTPNFSIMSELGYGIAYFNFGIGLKF